MARSAADAAPPMSDRFVRVDNPDEQAPERQGEATAEPVDTHEIGKSTYIVAQVDPLDVDGVRTVQVGTAMWLVAFVLLLPFYGRLQEDDKLWWLWTCLAGFGLGLVGWDYCRRRRNRRQARARTQEDAT
jgi:Protein of unknown function (DUF2530)